MVVGHFVVPFLFLLRQRAKKDMRQICAGACWLLFVHMLDIYWMIIPERGPSLSSWGRSARGRSTIRRSFLSARYSSAVATATPISMCASITEAAWVTCAARSSTST